MPPNRRVNRPVPVRRPKIAGGSRSIRPRTTESTTGSPSPVAEPNATEETAAPPVQTTHTEQTPEQPEPATATPQPEAERREVDVDESAPAEAPPSRRRRPSLQTSLIAAVVAVAVLVGVATIVQKLYFDSKVSNQAYVDNAATDEVKAAAANALTAISGYDFDKIDEWPDAARAVLTDEMKQDFDKTVDVTKSAALQAKTSTEVQVDPVGVTLLEDERAEVLAFMTVSVTNDGQAQGSSSGPQLIRMQKVDGRWLLSEVVLQ